MKKSIAIFGCIFVISGCVSTSSVLEVGKDTFTVSSTADGFRDASSAREKAYQKGQERCSSLNKKFMLVNEHSGVTRMGIDTTIRITFRCLNAQDQDYERPVIKKTPDIVIEHK